MEIGIDENEQLSPVEYARAKRFSLNYVYALLWTGALPGVKVDGKWRINRDAIPKHATNRINQVPA